MRVQGRFAGWHRIFSWGLILGLLTTLLTGFVPARSLGAAAPSAAGVLSWGYVGQTLLGPYYGAPSVQREPSPQQVIFPLGVNITAIAAGGSDGTRQPRRGHSVALASNGTVWDWGYDGQPSTPTQVPGLTGVIAIAAGADHNAALRGDGTVSLWNAKRELVPIAGLDRVTAIAAGGDRTVALRDDGTVWQYGGGTTAVAGFEQVPDLTGIVAIAAGGRAAAQYDGSHNFHGLALKRDGSVWNWGVSIFGQLGENAEQQNYYSDIPAPVQVPPLRDIVALGAGNTFSYCIVPQIR